MDLGLSKPTTAQPLSSFGTPSERSTTCRRTCDSTLQKRQPRVWLEHLDHGGRIDTIDVGAACDEYVAYVRANGGAANANDLEARFKR